MQFRPLNIPVTSCYWELSENCDYYTAFYLGNPQLPHSLISVYAAAVYEVSKDRFVVNWRYTHKLN